MNRSVRRRSWRRHPYRWVRAQEHILSPQNDRWRAAAFPDLCSRQLLAGVALTIGDVGRGDADDQGR